MNRFGLHKPDDQGADLIQYKQWNQQKRLAHDIGRGQDSRDNSGGQYEVFAAFVHAGACHFAVFGQQPDNDGQLKHQPEWQQKAQNEIEIVVHGPHGLRHPVTRLIKQIDRQRKDKQVSKHDPKGKQQQHGQEDQPKSALLLRVESRRRKIPYLVDDHGHRTDQGCHQADFHLHHQGLGHLGGDHINAAGNQRAQQKNSQLRAHLIEHGGEDNSYCRRDDDQHPPQRMHMFDQRFFSQTPDLIFCRV